SILQLNDGNRNSLVVGATGAESLVVQCNEAGTAWMYQDMPLTHTYCGTISTGCAPSCPTAFPISPNKVGVAEVINGCGGGGGGLTCTGPTSATISLNNGAYTYTSGVSLTHTADVLLICDPSGRTFFGKGVGG
ncbi:hypothetical protein PENTCL1PPCAC_3835, partial [Pristionchus entomophagus]